MAANTPLLPSPPTYFTTAFITNLVAFTTPNKTVSPNSKTVTSSKPPAPSSTTPPFPLFWLEATTTAAYLINRLPTKTLNMESLYQKCYHQSPSYLHLKTFGCLCYPWTAYTCTNKLDPKSSTCIFLGYSSYHKGFWCFDPHTSKIIISRHVRFHEHEFSMAQTTNTPSQPHISTIHNPLPPLLTPTFYPPPPSSSPTTNRPSTTLPPPPPPPRITDTHIQYQRRRPPPTTLPLPPSQPPHYPLCYPYPSRPPQHLKPPGPPPNTQ